jgi:hypothetical protein
VSRTVCSSIATGSQATPTYSVHSSGVPRARRSVQRHAHSAVSKVNAASSTGRGRSSPKAPSSKRAQHSPTTATSTHSGRQAT